MKIQTGLQRALCPTGAQVFDEDHEAVCVVLQQLQLDTMVTLERACMVRYGSIQVGLTGSQQEEERPFSLASLSLLPVPPLAEANREPSWFPCFHF